MEYPNDVTPLVMADRQGVEIDYCPQCRGVWLARAERNKINEQGAEMQKRTAPQPVAPSAVPWPQSRQRKSRERSKWSQRTRFWCEGFLGEIFEFWRWAPAEGRKKHPVLALFMAGLMLSCHGVL
jgi:Zn-finger nucleic acid-binding protein